MKLALETVQAAQRGDRQAVGEMVGSIRRHIEVRARYYVANGSASTFDDLVQVGTIGAMKAIRRFEPQRGVKFQTFADYYVRNEMLNEGRRTAILFSGWTAAERIKTGRRKPASATDVDARRLLGGTACLDDMPWLHDPSQDPDRSLDRKMLTESCLRAIAALPDRERFILETRYLTVDDVSLEELGVRLGVSRERVRQIETRALKRIRASFEVMNDAGV